MRAGYLAVALAVLGTLALGVVVGWTAPSAPGPGSVATALGLDGPDAPDRERRRSLAVSAAIRGCMAAHGFPRVEVDEPTLAIPDAELDPVAWAARWGFGISTGIVVAASPDARDLVRATDVVAARLASLPPVERDRFHRALDGDATAPGCRERAGMIVDGLRERLLAPLRTPLEALEALIEADGAMTAVREHWRRCVAGVATLVGTRDAPLARQRFVPALVAAFQRSVRAAMSDGRALAALQDRERAAAVTVARCDAGFATGRASVAAPHEAAFVTDHADELRTIGEAIRAAEAAWPTAGP